jgi:PAS domain S-box-containing protein
MKLAEAKDKTTSIDSIIRLVDNVPEVLYSASLTPALCVEFISAKAYELTGYSVDEILSDNSLWSSLIKEGDMQRYQKALERCQETSQSCEVEYRIETKDGIAKDLFDRMSPVLDEGGKVVAVDGMIVDITERKRIQQELERTQMLQTLGSLVAGIAHEINTPIQFISDNINFLSDSFKEVFGLMEVYRNLKDAAADNSLLESSGEHLKKVAEAEAKADIEFLAEEIPQAITQSLEGMDRVLTIVNAMRGFSHIDERRKAPSDLNKAIQSSLIILRNELKYVSEVVTELDEDLPMVVCSIDEMCQVFMNLFINAAHSIADVIDRGEDERGTIRVKTYSSGKDVIIEVSDTGTGIKPEVIEKIFEPFFTTKEAGKGTGQGLAFVRSIVTEKHTGDLDIETEVGKGTTFKITLPVSPDEPERE